MSDSVFAPKRVLVTLSLAAASACASTATPTQRTPTTYIPGASTITLTDGTTPLVRHIAAPMSDVWRILPAVYDSVGVPVTLVDPKLQSLGTEGFKVRQKLGGARLSSFIECGTTQVGPNADSYEVFLTVITQIEGKDPTDTKVTTTITAAAKPMQFAQEYSRCSSKNTLEEKIYDVLKAKLKR